MGKNLNPLVETITVLAALVKSSERRSADDLNNLRDEMFEEIDARIATIPQKIEEKKDVIHQEIINQIKEVIQIVDMPADVVRDQKLDESITKSATELKNFVVSLNDTLVELHNTTVTQTENNFGNIKKYIDETIDGLNSKFAHESHIHSDLISIFADLERKVLDTDHRALERSKMHFDQNASVSALLSTFQSNVENLFTKNSQWQKISEGKLASLLSKLDDLKEKTERADTAVESKFNSLETYLRAEFRGLSAIYAPVSHVHDELYAKLDHKHNDYALRDHTHKDISDKIITLRKEIVSMIGDKLSLSDLNKTMDEIAKRTQEKIVIPADGKDGNQWEFAFDDRQRGLLWFKREDQKEWKSHNLIGPRGEPGKDSVGGGGGGHVGGGGGATEVYSDIAIWRDGVSVLENARAINIGAGLTVLIDGTTATIETVNNSNNPVLFIQPSAPAVASGTKYAWIQTNPSNGKIVTVWYDDGIH